ncbi:unnamed protein product [Ectocarpus sp. 12 AP-2014]
MDQFKVSWQILGGIITLFLDTDGARHPPRVGRMLREYVFNNARRRGLFLVAKGATQTFHPWPIGRGGERSTVVGPTAPPFAGVKVANLKPMVTSEGRFAVAEYHLSDFSLNEVGPSRCAKHLVQSLLDGNGLCLGKGGLVDLRGGDQTRRYRHLQELSQCVRGPCRASSPLDISACAEEGPGHARSALCQHYLTVRQTSVMCVISN